MKNIYYLFLACLFIFSACDPSGMSDSNEANVTSLTINGQIGNAVIDQNARTISITLEPMAISDAVSTIVVSAGAIGTTPSLVDGSAAPFTVTAEDGTVTNWSVTVNIAFGISFDIDGNHVVLLEGMIDEDESDFTAFELCDYDPIIYDYDTDDYRLHANLNVWELNDFNIDIYYPGLSLFDISFVSPGVYTCNSFGYYHEYTDASDLVLYYTDLGTSSDTEILFTNVSITETHNAACTGNFSGLIDRYAPDFNTLSQADVNITNGCFKTKYFGYAS